MDEYIKREAAVAIIEEKQKELCPLGRYSRTMVYGSDRDRFDSWQEIINSIEDIPAADVVDGETYRELLKAARKMHCWIFLNTADELDAYDECGLTDEMNALLGYGGQFTAKMDGGADK